ncbi:thiamine-phosphate kinase [Leadbetterella byssophila DSM 17132]|uniref:Thiamine-monophosphate kinase n=1 Tax=Leadbetterella byssophila (strain DSM 17132 / JCM 16389 / KACC 11308 / NBRC 106382 / 4M15) TaxID=649349 RepID=E4RW80_LEAB4|nr:thiamine-phosphate kinase [Leadbetterella byssophila]ADQ17115.1 thiamine-phosphate kinase [Leadbetterella byssophila DSM 17132]
MKKLEELGEFGLIDRIKSQTSLKNTTSFVGIGDDAAVIDQGSHYSLLSTDLMVEGVHFDLAYHPLKHLGYKAVAVNVSDIAAMNGIPKQITVSIAISNRFGLAAVDELYEGIHLGCEAYNVDLVGGDTTASRAGIVISVSVLGEVTKDKLVLRSGSRENDILCVTGDLGAAYMGVQVLEREKQEFLANPNMQPQLENKSYLVGKQLKPDARMDIIHELAEKGVVPTSMMDISDGLASEILHLSKASGNGFTVFFDNIPIENLTLETSTEFNINPVVAVVNGGEDYELLMTIKQEDYENIKGILDLTPIGFVNNEKMNWLVLNSGEKTEIKAPGWK